MIDILIANSSDWIHFSAAINACLHGINPYAPGFEFFNPPWIIPFLIPFVLIPYGRLIYLVVAFLALAFVAYKLEAKPLGIAVFLLSPVVFDSLVWGNVEWLTLLGLCLSPMWGIVLLALKPQMTIAIIAFLAIETYHRKSWRGLIRLFAPLFILTILSIIFFGAWFTRTLNYANVIEFNFNFFPWSLPVGIFLFVQSLRTHNICWAIAASPMFFPALSLTVWVVVGLALVSSLPKVTLATIGEWAYVFGIGRL